MNRLARERSPYLLQHAGNPVDWYPWGEEAFQKARAEDKPIFLSIGYSTCHWCHVMEHESFEHAAVAAVLNEHFVSIKVDREERPDVDRVYMTFVQATTGHGGWPMSVWLTPDLKPFYGGTYFPPTSKWGRPGFVDILGEIARVWRTDRDKVRESADHVADQLRASQTAPTWTVPGPDALAKTAAAFRHAFDGRNGGFGDAPKFPRPSELLFLLREHARTGEDDLRDMVLKTLTAMALGGMRDHVGGGFHRYSVDAAWRVPHFEKMLYDQAQLVLAYLEAAQVSRDPFYADVAEDTLRYVMREMTAPEGGFYSAEDADSVPPEKAGDPGARKTEGAFYLWRAEELDGLLGADAEMVKRRFGVEPGGNAPADPQQEFVGKNLLFAARSIEQVAAELNRTAADTAAALDRARLAMFEARLTRPRPHLDDKVLTSWNGLMIAAFARGARCRGQSEFLEAARRAASFLRERMWNERTGTLLRRFRDGEAAIEGYAEDYACLVFGLLELFQADPDPAWLDWTVALQRRQDELFWDEADGGWFSTTGRDPSVLLRMKEDYDGAEPSASSISVHNLLLLSHLVEGAGWSDHIDRTIRLYGARIEQVGRAVPMMAAALSMYHAGVQQVVIVRGEAPEPARSATRVSEGDGREQRGGLEEAVASRHLPFAVVLALDAPRQQALAARLPLVAAMRPVAGGGAATAYVCRNFTCGPPVTTVADLEKELRG